MPERIKPVGRMHGTWIWFWYSDATRLLLVLFPGHFLVLLPVMLWLHWSGAAIKGVLLGTYLLGIALAMADNDYENLRRIGLDPYRRPLKPIEFVRTRQE
jgi:hypothetical protein